MSSSRHAPDGPQQSAVGLQLTLPVLVTACVLFVAALVLAYLGGVMTGRAQWASSLEESRAALAQAAATDSAGEEAPSPEAQAAAGTESPEDVLAEASVLAASELRFSRALRAEPGARLEPVSPPLPAARAAKPAAEGAACARAWNAAASSIWSWWCCAAPTNGPARWNTSRRTCAWASP